MKQLADYTYLYIQPPIPLRMQVVLKPHPLLDERQFVMAGCILADDTVEQMGDAINRSPATADKEMRKLYRKFEVNSRVTFIKRGFELGFYKVVPENE